MTSTPGVYGSVFKRLAAKELILPFFETAMLADNWPESYTITIDSSPYYGLDEDGNPDGYFHPSTHPLMGARELYLRFHPATRDKIVRERKSLQSHMTLAIGSALHGVVQTQMQMAGLVKPENVELEYTNDQHNVRGRIDFVVDHPSHGALICEMKTMNAYRFAKQDTVKPAWEAQLSLALDHYGADFGVLLLVEAGWPYHCKEFRVPRNDKLLSEIYQKFDMVRAAIELNTPPRPCCPLESLQMKACDARFLCWLSEDEALRP